MHVCSWHCSNHWLIPDNYHDQPNDVLVLYINIFIILIFCCRLAVGLFMAVLVTIIIIYCKHKTKRRTRVQRIGKKYIYIHVSLLCVLNIPNPCTNKTKTNPTCLFPAIYITHFTISISYAIKFLRVWYKDIYIYINPRNLLFIEGNSYFVSWVDIILYQPIFKVNNCFITWPRHCPA